MGIGLSSIVNSLVNVIVTVAASNAVFAILVTYFFRMTVVSVALLWSFALTRGAIRALRPIAGRFFGGLSGLEEEPDDRDGDHDDGEGSQEDPDCHGGGDKAVPYDQLRVVDGR